MNTGTIVQVVGPVVDVAFPGALPAISNALTVEFKVGNQPAKLTLEVQQHLGDRWVRAVSMSGTEGLKRGFTVTDSGAPISMPVGPGVMGRVLDVNPRNDINWHRTFMWVTGFFYNPKFRYNISLWSLGSTEQTLLFGNLQYRINDALGFGVGIGPSLTNRSLQGSWPFWAGSDRQMAEEALRGGCPP